MINKQRYITIQEFMVFDLQLKGNDLLVYAIIFGFSQDGKTKFTGSRQYFADWTRSTKNGIDKNLDNLVRRGLIKKEIKNRNGVVENEYFAVLPPPPQVD